MSEETPLSELENEPTTQVLPEEEIEEIQEPTEEEVIAKEEEAKRVKKQRTSDRIKDLNTKFRVAERDNIAKDKRIAELEDASRIKSEPDIENYDDRDKFNEDNKQWKDQQRTSIRSEVTKEVRGELQQEQYQKTLNKQKEIYIESRVALVKEDPKFHSYEIEIDDSVARWEAPEIQDFILSAKEQGPKIVQYLGTHSDELEEIASSSQRQRAFLMGKLIAKLEAKPVKTKSTAPSPTTSERGGARSRTIKKSAGYDPKKEDWKAFARRRNGIK